jgi:hypothetical protein
MKAAILRRPWPEQLDACIHAFATRKRLAGAPCGAHSSVLDGHRRSSALKPATRGKDHISGLARFLQSAKANPGRHRPDDEQPATCTPPVPHRR